MIVCTAIEGIIHVIAAVVGTTSKRCGRRWIIIIIGIVEKGSCWSANNASM